MRLIDADALKEKFPSDAKITIGHYTFIDHSVGIMFVRETIDDAPTIDAVEVVRCKECRWGHLCVFGQHLGLDGFCSKGERKEKSDG